MKDEAPSPRVRYAFAAIAATAAALVVVGVFVGLPARWSVVDVPAALLAAVEIAAAVFLVRWRPVSRRVIRAASAVVLAFGLAFVAILAWTASYLFGVYGPIGKGGAVIYLFVLALALPYLVAVPALRLVWVGPRERA